MTEAALLTFTLEPMREVRAALEVALERQSEVHFRVPDPDLALETGMATGTALHQAQLRAQLCTERVRTEHYPGESTPLGRHRPYQTWLDLAERLGCDFLTPRAHGNFVELHFRKRPPVARSSEADRYGPNAEFQRIDKLEEPCFLEDFLEALGRVRLTSGARVLSVGVNSGNELRALGWAYPNHALEVVGLDLNAGALELARARFPRHTFLERDLNALPDPLLGRFDLILALSVLQSSGLEQDRVFRALVQGHLAPHGAVIIGLPNSRFVSGRLEYGARMLNFSKPELSLLLADLALYRRYLHKHGFRVWVTGKYEVLLTAVRV